MAKVFFSYQQQIEKLVKEKDLLIADEEYAKEMLNATAIIHLSADIKIFLKIRQLRRIKKGQDLRIL